MLQLQSERLHIFQSPGQAESEPVKETHRGVWKSGTGGGHASVGLVISAGLHAVEMSWVLPGKWQKSQCLVFSFVGARMWWCWWHRLHLWPSMVFMPTQRPPSELSYQAPWRLMRARPECEGVALIFPNGAHTGITVDDQWGELVYRGPTVDD